MQRLVLADKASVSRARRLVHSDLERAGVEVSIAFECLVALTEACTNALIHAPSDDGDPRSPVFEWQIHPTKVFFRVRDFSSRGWSRPLHPTSHPEPTIENIEPGGLGLEIIWDVMDEVDIRPGPDGTEVLLRKYLRTREPAIS